MWHVFMVYNIVNNNYHFFASNVVDFIFCNKHIHTHEVNTHSPFIKPASTVNVCTEKNKNCVGEAACSYYYLRR